MNKTPTDTEMLDWLSKRCSISIKAHYQAFVDERTPKEVATGGYNGNIDFFSIPSQHISNCKTLRRAIAKAMSFKSVPWDKGNG